MYKFSALLLVLQIWLKRIQSNLPYPWLKLFRTYWIGSLHSHEYLKRLTHGHFTCCPLSLQLPHLSYIAKPKVLYSIVVPGKLHFPSSQHGQANLHAPPGSNLQHLSQLVSSCLTSTLYKLNAAHRSQPCSPPFAHHHRSAHDGWACPIKCRTLKSNIAHSIAEESEILVGRALVQLR